jgi:RNA polymerase-binding transcription factor DksA
MDFPTQSHLVALRNLLTFRREELLAEVHAAGMARQRRREALPSDPRPHADQSVDMQEDEVDDAQAQRDLEELAAVDAALGRMTRGAFGDCSDCGKTIALQRLLAQPAAARCARCQAAREAGTGPAARPR